jgi:hypothetical protein
MENPISPPRRREPWNKGRLIGQKRPLKPRDVWTIRVRLQLEGRKRAPSVPNDCWFGVMAPDKAPHGQLVATGPVAQWRVGMSLVVYPTNRKLRADHCPCRKRSNGDLRHVAAYYGYSYMDFRAGAGRQGLGRR